EQPDDARVLVRRQALLGGQIDRHRAAHQGPGTMVGSRRARAWLCPSHAWTDRKSFSPSSPPTSRTVACPAFVMRPAPVRSRLHTRATLRSEPFGLASGPERWARTG